MPYIKQADRKHARRHPQNAGELNFAVTMLIVDYLKALREEPHYEDYNEVIGVLECAKLELYEQVVASYEYRKRQENGDVYGDI